MQLADRHQDEAETKLTCSLMRFSAYILRLGAMTCKQSGTHPYCISLHDIPVFGSACRLGALLTLNTLLLPPRPTHSNMVYVVPLTRT